MIPGRVGKSKSKTTFVCQNCGAQRPRWEGRCSECGSWNTIVEEVTAAPADSRSKNTLSNKPVSLEVAPLQTENAPRLSCTIKELDRVLGGGLVQGSFCLLGGEPGIGKSTLILQMAAGLAKSGSDVLYISAEESVPQTGQRAKRLGINHPKIKIGTENNLESICELAKLQRPAVLVVDSIQTVYLPDLSSAPGSVSQVRECAGQLMNLAKSYNISVIVIGHVTKDGNIAGPKVLEHLVDTVLSFEGDQNHHFRLLRALKNRFGATHELGIFQMGSEGLREVANPSEMFLEERTTDAVGSVVFCSMEGTRPLLCEVQALTVKSPLPNPRRTAIGFDLNRVHLLIAVLDRHANLNLSFSDIFVNVVGGLKLIEPAADLAVAAALISTESGHPVDSTSVYFGEIGLTGEIRAVPFIELRIREADKLGFSKFYVAASNKKHIFDLPKDLVSKIIWVKHIRDLIDGTRRPMKAAPRATPLTI